MGRGEGGRGWREWKGKGMERVARGGSRGGGRGGAPQATSGLGFRVFQDCDAYKAKRYFLRKRKEQIIIERLTNVFSAKS